MAPCQSTSRGARRHDLDALRAFAMLLGIVLHGTLAFIPDVWAVTDASVEDDGTLYWLLLTAIHGFRMPLFFLMSGFFTAMLWKQRGLGELLKHRAKRILLPLAIALLTVVPLTALAWDFAAGLESTEEGDRGDDETKIETSADSNIWAAAALGDNDALELHIADGTDIDADDPTFGVTPLAWAALHGHTDTIAWLINNGADIGARNRDGSTALHSAAFLGRTAAVKQLLALGAEANALDAQGATPLDSSRTDYETTKWMADLLGITFDDAEMKQGRNEVSQLLGDASAQSGMAGDVAPYRNGAAARAETNDDLILGWYWSLLYSDEWGRLFTDDVFSHLWFLWYLVWLAAIFILIVWLATRLKITMPRISERLVTPPALYLWVLPLTMAAQYFMGIAGQTPSFGADTFTGLLPSPHVLLYYGIFFAFGAIYFAQNDAQDDEGKRIGRLWQLTLPLALIVFLVGIVLTFPEEGGAAHGLRRIVSLLLQSAYAWMMIFGLMGLFRAALGAGSQRVRYISDASYWLYLMHLPLIIALQGLIQDWQLPSIIKLTMLVAATFCVLLLCYELFVRYTPLGTLLNGKRSRVAKQE